MGDMNRELIAAPFPHGKSAHIGDQLGRRLHNRLHNCAQTGAL